MVKKLLLGLTFFMFSLTIFAQTPANDLCEDAVAISCGETVLGSTLTATFLGVPPTCGGINPVSAPGVWYSFVGNGDAVTVSLCGSQYNSQIEVFSGNCNSLVCVGGNDNFCGPQSEITFVSDASTNYLFYVNGFGGNSGDYTLSITCATPSPSPINDLCEDAIPVVCGDIVAGNTELSTILSSPEDGCGTANGAPGNWYSFAGTGDTVDLSLCSVTDYDTKIRVYSGNCFVLSCVGGNDDSCGLQSELTFVSDASTNYFIYVFGFGNATGDYELTVSCTTPGPPPMNDECVDAIVAEVNADEFCNLLTPGTLADATASNVASTCPGTANDDVWFEFVALAETQVIEIQNITGSPTNLVHGVYEGACDALVEVSCSDPDQSTVGGLTIGETYFVRVFTFGTDVFNTVSFDLCIRLAPPPPANDFCVDAIPIACGDSLAGTTVAATDTDEPSALCGVFNDGTAPGVWYSFAGIDGTVTISLCGSELDTQLQVFSGDCDNLVCVAGNDDNFPACGTASGLNSELFFNSVAGTNYLIYVNGFGSNIGDFNIEISCLAQSPTIDLVCADGPLNDTFCYEDNSTIAQVFQGDSAFPLRLTINSGMVEFGDDEFIVLDSDGVTNLNTDTPYGNNGDLTGLVFTATGNSISLSVESDASISCGDGANAIIDYTVVCLECTDPVATYTIVGDCTVSDQFSIEVNVTDAGTLNDLTISDNQGSAPQNVTAPGVVTFGPYTANTDLVAFTLDPADVNCVVTSEVFTFTCAIDCYTILNVTDDLDINCDVSCVDLTATFVSDAVPGVSTGSYRINGPICDVPMIDGGTPTNITNDDTWSAVIDMTFPFNYFGTEYSSLVIGPNGQISFDLTLAGGFNGWNSQPGQLLPITDGNFPLNTIYGAFHDMDPSINPDPTQINYFISGEPGSRMFVLNFNDVEHFGGACAGFSTTQQIILFESINVIDVNLINKPLCLGWNDGLATVGLMGNDLTEFSVPDGRNTDAWEATNETWRFIPDGPLDPTVNTTFEWQDEDGTIIGTDFDITVCPTQASTTYTAVVTTTNSNGDEFILSEEVTVTRNESICGNFDCTDTQFFESFGEGTVPEDHNFLPAPYSFDGSGQLDPTEYSVQNGLSPINGSWHQDLEDQTVDDTNGNALLINASDLAAEAEFYRRSITVVPNTDYFFVIWVTTMYDTDSNICPDNGDPTNFIYRFEDTAGATVSSMSTGDIPNGPEFNWIRYVLEFNSGSNTTLDLVLENTEFGSCGNDFAIDDIGLFFEGTPPDLETPIDLIGCDIDQDGFAEYDLTSQNDFILNGLSPANFNITFHTSEEDAMMDINAIVDPAMYTNTLDPETIWVRVERANQDTCFSITQFMLELGPIEDLGIVLPPLFEICSNEEFPAIDGTVLNPDVDPTMITYTWTDVTNTIVSTDAIFVPTAGGVYTLEIIAPVCGVNIFTTEVVVFEAPMLDLGMDESFCVGDDPFRIDPIISGDITGITYEWTNSSGTIVSTEDFFDATVTDIYTLTITVGVCTASASIAVEFLALPGVTLGGDFQTCPEMDTTIMATVDLENQDNLVFEWIGPDDIVIPNETGSTLVIQIPAGTAGALTYTVNVLNGNCVGSDTIDISLYDVDNCIISQGVSPNGDGLNDTLDLQFLSERSGIEEFKIFNRLGTAVYEQRNYVNEWGGQTDDGDELPTGTYFYTIQLDNEDPEFGTVATGWVYLNRGN